MKINNKGKNKIVNININIKRCCHREKFISNFYPFIVLEK